jgi:hypothetical protein
MFFIFSHTQEKVMSTPSPPQERGFKVLGITQLNSQERKANDVTGWNFVDEKKNNKAEQMTPRQGRHYKSRALQQPGVAAREPRFLFRFVRLQVGEGSDNLSCLGSSAFLI